MYSLTRPAGASGCGFDYWGLVSFVGACLRFAAVTLGAQSYTLAVAAFNQRAITVYERAGFREVERFEHFTNGGLHAFIRMARGPINGPC